MKLRKINILAAFVAVISFTACSKDDGAIPDRVNIDYLPAVTTNVTGGIGTAGTITLANQAAFEGKITMALYFANATPPDKYDIVVRKNGSNTNVKVFKAGETSLPANLVIKASDIETLFGQALVLNDTYDFGPDVYVGTKKYEAFPQTGTPLGQGITGMSGIGYGAFVKYSVK